MPTQIKPIKPTELNHNTHNMENQNQGGTLYIASNNLHTLKIEEVKYIRKTLSFYWRTETTREALESNWTKSFGNKEGAINYLKSLIQDRINSAEYNLKMAKEKMAHFKQLYNA